MSKRITPEEAAELKNNYIKFYDGDNFISLTTEVVDPDTKKKVQKPIEGFVFDIPEIVEAAVELGAKKLVIEPGAHEDGTFAPIIRVVSEAKTVSSTSTSADALFQWSQIFRRP